MLKRKIHLTEDAVLHIIKPKQHTQMRRCLHRRIWVCLHMQQQKYILNEIKSFVNFLLFIKQGFNSYIQNFCDNIYFFIRCTSYLPFKF